MAIAEFDNEKEVSAPVTTASAEQQQHRLVFAYYITGHGFGHATRVVEVVRHLIKAGHDVHVVTGAPFFVFTSEIDSPSLFIRKVLLDCGAVQADALTVDRLASLQKYSETAVVPRESILATEVTWLKSIKADLVVSDVVPVACRAAADAGIRSVCVTNFSWDFIYAEYVMTAGYNYRPIIWQIAEDYSHCEFLIRLPGYCPMPAFRDVIDVPLVVRRLHKSRMEVRQELGIGEDVKLVIFNFGGQLAGWKLKKESLPDGWLCLVCGASDNEEIPPNFRKLEKDVYTPDLIAASDCMLGKIGYGTVSEALAYKIPFVFVRRDYFNEEPFLRNMLEYYQCGVEMIRRDLLTGHWEPYLLHAVRLKPCYEGSINGGEVAARVLQDTAIGKKYASQQLSGARRLRDAIVLGFQLQRAPGRDADIPEWYAVAETELGLHSASQKVELNVKSCIEEFEILHGDHHGLPDTLSFLKCLAELDTDHALETNSKKRKTRECIAASGLFNWEEELFVARAPGRLDVMGGIADYSGSLVLQVCTDNASNYKLAGKWLMEKEGSKLYWMPCAAHCLNLMLGDVGKLPLVKEIVHEAQQISIFIYNHKHVLHLMRKETKGREILRPSVTRFATTFLCLQSMYDKHQHLRDMVRRDDWRRSKWPKNKMAIEIVKKIKSSTFWNTMHTCLKIMAPIVDVLRMVDTEEKPSMAYVYSAMEICKAKIKANIGEATLEDRNLWKKMERIVDKRWSDLLQKPLHCAAHYLNPQVYYASVQSSMEIESNQVIKEGLLQCIEKLAEDEEKETQILSELSTYRSRGARLGKKNAISCLKTMAPVEWWITFGSEVPALQRFATRVLGLTCSASPCERNWSTFSNLPIREACHVAVQRIHPSKQKLWKHAQARQTANGRECTPVLEIVSYGSELSNRGPTFDMDLTDFMDGDQPISYEKAKAYFARDPSQKWAAYVAGTILVLMTELGIRFDDSISILVSSAVPEGKGVSSSAAVEVATMSAIAAAYGLIITPRDLALLCQKVENHIVGAPCGIMDQMTSACGEAHELLAMVCQPAEVIGHVKIPTHVRFWGFDSGIRHSIGGADYGSVRVGTFMGRKIITSMASSVFSRSLCDVSPSQNRMTFDEFEEDGVELLEAEASLDYLCNLSPHRYEAAYAKRLPETMLGETFLEQYADHNDSVTVIDPERSYGLRAPASHPIHENLRVKAFKALLTADISNEQLSALGELMYQCHYSYSACGLGSDGTDRLVKLVQEMQNSKISKSENGTLFGAKITGGGSGGSICVMGRHCLRSSEQILEIQQKYKAATGYLPFIFEGSSPGAGKFGYLKIRRRFPANQC